MYPQFLTLVLFGIATSFTPGPNNIMASHSGFNFGFKQCIVFWVCPLDLSEESNSSKELVGSGYDTSN